MTAPARSEMKTTSRAPLRDQGRVLLVTDDRASTVYSAALESENFLVAGVVGGMAALVALRRTRPHVLIVHTNLRGIGADKLTRMLVRAPHNIPFILVGAESTTTERRTAALASGAFDYFQIPAEQSLLVERTKQLVELKQTLDSLRAEADLDYLTELANRRRFCSALGQEVERWRRYNLPCALLLADLDHLKLINDRYGHTAGDIAIRHVANALKEFSRDNDTAARFGGEEFALLLAGTDDERALAAAERLREAVAGERLEEIGTVTISLGVASCPVHATSERALYAASDAALYRAKGAGRNCSIVAAAINRAQK